MIGFAVETHCEFYTPIAFPDVIDAGLAVSRIGKSSVRYEVALFKQGSDAAAAFGYFIHVFVDRTSQRPVPIPGVIRKALERLISMTGE